MIDGQSAHLFRRHVPDGPQHDARFGRRRYGCQRAAGNGLILRQLRQAKVENLDAIVAGYENVLRFQIAMGDPLFVGRGKAVRDRQRQLNRLANPDRTGTETIAQRLALEQLRYDEGRGAVSADVVDGEDVWVGQRRGGSGFLLEPMKAIDAGRVCGRQDLDRDVTSQPRIAGAIHLAHPAGAQERHDLVRPEAGARL